MRFLWIFLLVLLPGLYFSYYAVTNRGESGRKLFESCLADLETGESSGVRRIAGKLRNHPSSVELAEILDAVLCLRAKYPESALRILAALNQEGPARTEILRYGGEALYASGRFAEAARTLAVVVSENPDNIEAIRWLSASYYDLGAFDAAIVQLQSVIRLDPTDFRPHHLLGVIYSDFEQYAEAIDHFTIALNLKPFDEQSREIRLGLAEAHVASHDYEAALKILKDVGASGRADVVRASCFRNQGKYSEAVAALQEAKTAGEISLPYFLLCCDLLEDQGAWEDAVLTLQSAIELYPGEAELRYRLALALRKAGHESEAAAEMAVWESKRLLAGRLTELNLQAISDPYDPEVRDELAAVCQQLGKKELATMWKAAAESCRMSTSFQ